ncbi:FeoA domain-containing protein [Methyloprofundus sedimenti]|uniref:FeoA domain-containing protein n=1 Tax=Methyloprofundus sedimenti TaxID=1420851 RepID=UPI0009B6D0BB
MARRLVQIGILSGSRLRVIWLALFGKTLQVSIDQGQYFALQNEEVNVLDCEMVTMPLFWKVLTHR